MVCVHIIGFHSPFSVDFPDVERKKFIVHYSALVWSFLKDIRASNGLAESVIPSCGTSEGVFSVFIMQKFCIIPAKTRNIVARASPSPRHLLLPAESLGFTNYQNIGILELIKIYTLTERIEPIVMSDLTVFVLEPFRSKVLGIAPVIFVHQNAAQINQDNRVLEEHLSVIFLPEERTCD